MSALVIALDGHKTVAAPTSDQFALWAFQAHLRECRGCSRGLEYCPDGRTKLAATAPRGNPDLPGYPAI